MAEEDEDDLMLMRLADGELSAEASEALLARIEASPDLAARFALFLETRERVAASFAPVLTAPVPERLVQAVLAADAAMQPANDRGTARPRNTARPLLAASVAALLAAPIGYLVGREAPPRNAIVDPFAGARTLLAETLESTPSGTRRSRGGASVQPFATHPVAGGACRDFLLEAPEGATLGIACRGTDGWVLRASVRIENAAAMRPASPDHPVLAAALERLGAAAPLDEQAEAALLRRGWR